DSEIRILAIQLKRSLTPSHAPLSIEAPYPGMDVHRDLADCKDKGMFRVRSLSDLATFRIGYKAFEIRIEVEVEIGGGVILHVDNAGLAEEELDDFRSQFLRNFGIPLDR